MGNHNQLVNDAVDNIKSANVQLYKVTSFKQFSIVFLSEILSLARNIEECGLKDFKVRTASGFTTIQPFGIASTLSFLKINNELFDVDNFLNEINTEKDGYFTFGYLLSSKITSEIMISDVIKVKPFLQAKNEISGINRAEIDNFLQHTSPEFMMCKDDLAVLMVTIPLHGMVFSADKDSSNDSNIPALLANNKLKEIQEVLSLISDNAIEILVSWGTYSDPRLDYLLGLSPHKNQNYYSEAGFAIFQSCMGNTEWSKLLGIHDLVIETKGSTELKVALDRVYSSMRNNDFMGKVLDLSIAMEILCVSGQGDNTYKVSNHIAWICSDDPSERKEIMTVIKDFYALRSKIVHSGSAKVNASRYESAEDLYKKALDYSKTALIEILKHGKKPDWIHVSANGGVLGQH